MRYSLSCSGGKDSVASLILAIENNLPLDEVVMCVPDPFRLELDFIKKLESFCGMPINIIPGPKFEEFFFRVKVFGANAGGIYGWPKMYQRACSRMLKWEPQEKWREGNPDTIAIVGIAADEKARLKGLKGTGDISYLAKYGLTQKDSRQLCEDYDLLNPLYEWLPRVGCVRCPKQPDIALRRVRELEPEKWQWCIENDPLSPVSFKPDGRTFIQCARAIEAQTEFTISSADTFLLEQAGAE